MSGLEGSNANTCVVCYKNVQIYSIGMCDHPVCYECSTRMRVLCRQNECPICRQDLPEVVFTRDIKPFRNPKNEGLPVRYNIYFESPYIHRKFYELLAENCTLCCKKKTFESFEELKDHMRHNHQLYHCDLCVENLKIFSRERRWYTRSELSLHRRKGDADDKSHRGHPLCEFCNQRYMDNDELYRHLRRDHLYCHFCDEDGLHQYYNSYDYLRDHFRLEHFLCEEGSCADEKFTSVFRSNIDLKAHRSSAHSKQLSKAAAKQARTLELEFTLAPRTRTRRLPFQNRREREFSLADGSGQSQASSSQSAGVQGVQTFGQLPAPPHHQQSQPHHHNHNHQHQQQSVGQAHQSFQTDDFPCYLEPTFMRPRVDVRSTEEFPTLGGAQSGSTAPQRPSGRSGNVTIRSTVRNHLPLAVTDENFPALGPDSVSKTVNVSLSGNPGGGGGNGASNVSIQVNHEANGTVMRVSGPNIRIRPTLKIDNDFPALGEASGGGSSAAGAPWKEVLQWTCSKGAAKMAAAAGGRKKGAQGHQQSAAAGIHGEDFPSLSKSKKQATITVVPTWGPQAQASGGHQQAAASGGQSAAKGKTKKRKEKQKSGLGSSGPKKEGKENERVDGLELMEGAAKVRSPKVTGGDDASRCSDVKMAENVSKIPGSKADAESLRCSAGKMAENGSKIPSSKADAENLQCSSKMAENGSKARNSKVDAESFQCSARKMADNAPKVRNSKLDADGWKFPDAKMADNTSRTRNSKADRENIERSDAKMADGASRVRSSKADKENCQFPDAKTADGVSRVRSSKADKENCQFSSAKMADGASKMRSSRTGKESFRLSSAKMADDASGTRDAKVDAGNFEFSDAKMAVVPFDYFDASGNTGSSRSDKDADDLDYYFGETGNPRKSAKFGSAESFDYFENPGSPRNPGKATSSKNGAEGAEDFHYFGGSASSKSPAKFGGAESFERFESKAAGNSKMAAKNGPRSVAEDAENYDYFNDVRLAGNSKSPAKGGAPRSAEDAGSFECFGGAKAAGNSKGRFDYFENAESSRSDEGAENLDYFNGNSRSAGSGNPGAESSEGFDYFNYTGKPRNAARTGSAWSNENDLEAGNPAKRRNADTGNPSKSRNPVSAGNDENGESSRKTGNAAENSRNGAKFGNSQNSPNFPSPESPENSSYPSLNAAVRSSNYRKDRRKQPRTMEHKDNDCYASLSLAKSVHNSSDSNDSSPEQSANSKSPATSAPRSSGPRSTAVSGGKTQRKRTELKIDGLNANSSNSNGSNDPKGLNSFNDPKSLNSSSSPKSPNSPINSNDSNSCGDCPASSVSSSSSAKPPGFTQPPPGFTNPPPGFSIKYALDNDLTFTNSSGETYSIVPERRRQRDLEKRPAYSPPADFQERNKRLVARLNDVLREQDDIEEFRRISGCFRQGSCTPNDYYEHCRRVIGQDTFREIFPELLLLLPDIAQQQELFRVFREGDNGGGGVWLEECPSCRQILRAGNELKAHREGHEKEKDFPELGKVGGGRGGWVRK